MNDIKKVLIAAICVVLVVAIAAGVSIGVMAGTMNGLKDTVAELKQANDAQEALIASMQEEIKAAQANDENLVTAEDFEKKLAEALGAQTQTMQSLITTAVKNQIEELGAEGLTEAQVQTIIDAAVENCLTEDDIDAIIADLDTGLSKDEVKKIVADYTAGTLTYAQIVNLIDDADYDLRKFLEDKFTKEINKVIAQVNALGGKLDEVEGSLGDFKDTISYTVDETNKVVEISTENAFVDFAKSVNEEGKTWAGYTVKLTNNMNLKDIDWEPIGQTGATQFRGVFDGQNYTVSNLTIDSTDETSEYYASGIFGWLNSTTVKNIKVVNATVKGNSYVGVIAGYMESISNCTISNCHVYDSTVTSAHKNDTLCGDKAGMIVGYAGNTKSLVENCSATDSTVSAGRDAGQLVGAAIPTNVFNCTATKVTVNKIDGCTGANIRNEIIGRVFGTTKTAASGDDLKTLIAGNDNVVIELGTAALSGAQGDYITLDGKNVTIAGGTIKGAGWDGEGNYAVDAESGNIVFDGVTFDFSDSDIKTGSWGRSVNISGTAKVTFKNCTFKGTQCPIYQSGADTVVILDNCTFESTVGMIQSEIYSGDFQLGQDLIIKDCDFTGMTDVLHIYDYDKDPSSEAIAKYLTDNGNIFTGVCKQTCK